MDPERLDAMERLTRAMQEAKAAKERGSNIQQVKATLKQAAKALMARDYDRTADLANRAMEMLGLLPLP